MNNKKNGRRCGCKADSDCIRPILVQAHRGASAYAPENTLPAFRLAVEMGADGVENDIHFTPDKVFLVSHDDSIERMSTGEGNLSRMTSRQARKYDYGVKFDPKFAGTKIPTLQEFLDVVKDMKVINIELKGPLPEGIDPNEAYDRLYGQVVKAGCLERTIISSFGHDYLKQLKERHGDMKTALLYGDRHNRERTLELVRTFHADAVHPHLDCIDKETVAACKKNGIQVNIWTVDSPQDIQRAIALDPTGIITNVPDQVLRALGR